ncbi:MAG: RNA polymerase sigma-54 factor [Acidobacteria bacterium]|nr:RNA polymerase sigma-54 factor [Acidobacteriota bacterium]
MVVRRNSLKPSLNVQLSQRLAMTPSLLQKIELLTLSRMELTEMLNEELAANPVLEETLGEEEEPEDGDGGERGSNGSLEVIPRSQRDEQEFVSDEDFRADSDETIREIDYYFGDSGGSQSYGGAYQDDDQPSFETFLVRPPSLYDYLETQINLCEAPEQIREVARYLIGNLNEDGYLLVSLEEAAESTGASLEQVERAHQIILQLDPVGVGSRSLQECLLTQIRDLYGSDALLEGLVTRCLPLLQQRKYKEIARELNCRSEEITRALEIIRKLAPRPGQKYNSQKPRYVQPDIYIYKTDGLYRCLEHPEFQSSMPRPCPARVRGRGEAWPESTSICGKDLVEYEITMNEDGLPKLRLSASYREMLKSGNLSRESRNYIKEKWRSAQELLKSVDQRKQTIYRVCCSIVRRQREFLEAGVTHLKPMLIKDLADELGVHSSTISRAVTNKYVHTPQGVMELRSFFTVGVESSGGENISIVHVKHKIRTIIEEESNKRPLSDQKIANMLNSEGIQITRRTVAKYRDQMKVLGSRERKALS